MTAFDNAKHTYERGQEYPYGGMPDNTDWATRAALAICFDLCDRRGIKQEMGAVDAEVQREIVESMASYIRHAHKVHAEGVDR